MKTGRSYLIGPADDPDTVLHDMPLGELFGQLSAEAAQSRLSEINSIRNELQRLAGRAADCGLDASWMRLESADDYIEEAAAALTEYIDHLPKWKELVA